MFQRIDELTYSSTLLIVHQNCFYCRPREVFFSLVTDIRYNVFMSKLLDLYYYRCIEAWLSEVLFYVTSDCFLEFFSISQRKFPMALSFFLKRDVGVPYFKKRIILPFQMGYEEIKPHQYRYFFCIFLLQSCNKCLWKVA